MSKIYYKTLYSTCFVFCLLFANAQDFVYKRYDRQDGLPNPTIHSIFQDKDGFLWIGTESGLCRYDGSRFKVFTVKDGLQGNEVFGIMQDTRGRLWLRQHKNSIAYIHNGKVYNQQNDSLLKRIRLSSRLYGIAEDAEGNIVLCDKTSLFIIFKDGHTIKTINSFDGKPLWLVSMGSDSEKKIVVCTVHDLYRIENKELRFIKRISPTGIAETGVILHPNYIPLINVGTTMLLHLKDTSIFVKLANFSLKYSSLSDSVFSINTTEGALLFNINTLNTVRVLPETIVTNTFIDSENNLWLGTMNNGVYKLSSDAIVNQRIGDTRSEIFYLTKSRDKIIAGNYHSELYEYSNKKFIKKRTDTKSPIGKIHYYEDYGNSGYVAADAHYVISHHKGLPRKELYLIAVKHVTPCSKDELLVSVNSGLYVVAKKDLDIRDTLWSRRTLCALQTGDSIFAGTPSGLFILKNNEPSARNAPVRNKWRISDSLLNSCIVQAVQRSADGFIWVATFDEGLYCIKNGKVVWHYTDGNGLPSNNCRSLYIDSNSVWLGTDKGVVKLTGIARNTCFQKYSTSEGLPSDNINTIYVDGNIVYIGTAEGLCYFDETKIETRSICNLVLTGVKIGDSTVDYAGKYFLRDRQRFVVEFSGISLRSEKAMTYRYRINGIDDDWRTTITNSLEFTALPFGDYTLEIVAINKFGKESAPLKIAFSNIRPFHKTILFATLVGLLAVGAILFLYSRWLNHRKQRQLLKLKQEIKLLELEQMALRAQMNPHFIFNCINAMQQLVIENDTENATRFIASFSNLVRQTLDNAPELFIPLKEEIKFLTSYFELERIRMEDSFSYVIDTTGIINPEQHQVPNMVIQPFIENAIKHGMQYKRDRTGFIEVKFTDEDGSLCCTITDNGIGREKAAMVKKQLPMPHVSKGMNITFQRVESLNTIMHGAISIEILDMKDEEKNATGTKVIITFQKRNI